MEKFKIFKVTPLFVIALIISVVGSIIELLIPLQVRKIIDFKKISIHAFDFKSIALAIALLAGSAVITAVSSFILSKEGDKEIYQIRLQVQKKLLTLPMGFFDNEQSGQLSSRVVNDSYAIKSFMTQTVPTFLTSIILVLGSICLLVTLDWQITLVIFISLPLFLIIVIPLGHITEELSWKSQKELSNITAVTTDSLRNIRTIKLNNAENQMVHDFKSTSNKIYKLSVKSDLISAIIEPIQEMVALLMFIVIILYGGIRVMDKTLSYGTLISIVLYFFQALPALNSLMIFYPNYKQVLGSFKQINSILHIKGEKIGFSSKLAPSQSLLSLHIKNVSFSYNKSLILSNINMHFNRMEKVAIVGPSGAGKSTIINLITRLYPVKSGDIFFNDIDSKKINLTQWRKYFSVVTQENGIVSGSIRTNLTLGLTERLPDAKLYEALKETQLLSYVLSLPQKLDSKIGEQGSHLSGGQKQKLQIARAYLRNSDVIIFDESTSNLDADSEKHISEIINKLKTLKIIIVVAHRLSTIVDADRIYFLENGKIISKGTHTELLRNLPIYRRFIKEQMLPNKNEKGH